jgi:hypothetical protein
MFSPIDNVVPIEAPVMDYYFANRPAVDGWLMRARQSLNCGMAILRKVQN